MENIQRIQLDKVLVKITETEKQVKIQVFDIIVKDGKQYINQPNGFLLGDNILIYDKSIEYTKEEWKKLVEDTKEEWRKLEKRRIKSA